MLDIRCQYCGAKVGFVKGKTKTYFTYDESNKPYCRQCGVSIILTKTMILAMTIAAVICILIYLTFHSL